MNPTSGARSGRRILLFALVGLALIAILAVSLPHRQRSAAGTSSAPSSTGPNGAVSRAVPTRLAQPDEAPATAPGDPATADAEHRIGAALGRGELLARVEGAGESAPPASWTLVVRGAEGAEEEGAAAGEELRVELALGTYTVTARASGLGAPSQTVSLTREAPQASLSFALEPLQSIPGMVQDSAGNAVSELAVSLLAAGGEVLSSARTDAAGRFVLDGVLPAEVELCLGDPRGPLVPQRRIDVSAPAEPLGTLVVPELTSLLVRVRDEAGQPIAEASVEGLGSAGGSLSGTTDAEGRLRAVHLPPGDYRLFARHPEHGRGTLAVALPLTGGAEQEIELPLVQPARDGG
jgi:hypothetical protein